MGIISWLAGKAGTQTAVPEPPRPTQRDFNAAVYSRITSSLASDTEHIMRTLRFQGRTLRARSRQLVDNNCYAAKFASMTVDNVCGPQPFRLQAKIKSGRGKLDNFANSRVETEWAEWGRPGQCDFAGRQSWADLQRLIVRTLLTDGEALLRVWEGTDYGPWGMQLQLLDTDRLDEDKNEQLANGSTIVAGVELDINGRTTAYHFLKSQPRSWSLGNVCRDYIRIPAAQIIHLFIPGRAEQVRGVPWLYAALINLHNMGSFDEAAIVAARVGASKMGFYTSPNGTLTGLADGTDPTTGAPMQNAEPGTFDILPEGYDFKSFDPAFPDAMVEPFKKAMLRGIASGLGVSYFTLANDLEAVNFSSARAGLLEERNHWMTLQDWLVEHLHIAVYRRWLSMADLVGRLPLSGPTAKYYDISFMPRRWQWVDPLKDVQANIEAIKWGLKSRTQVVAETGGDLEDIFDQLAAENRLAEEKDVEINPDELQAEAQQEEARPEGDTNDDNQY